MDDFLLGLKNRSGLLAAVVATAALALGFSLGTWLQRATKNAEASSAAQSQQMPMPEAPAQQVVPQRNGKHH